MRKKGKFAAFLGLVFCSFSLALGGLFGLKMSSGPIESRAATNGDVFSRISSVADLADGDEVIFVNQAETYACGTTQNTNNRTPVSISVTEHAYTYASKDNVQIFVVKTNSSGKFGFHTGSGYIYSASGSNNYLKTNSTAASTAPSDAYAWSLSVSSYVFSATNVTNTSYYLAFNGTSYFSQYKSGQSKPYIYKKVSNVTVTYNGNGSTSGSVPTDSSSPYEPGDIVTVLGNTGSLVRTNYTFTGWNTATDGSGTSYTAGDTFTITANTTLYAKWSKGVTGVSLNKASTTIYAGSTETLVATVAPADATNKNVTWESSDGGVATVSSSGVVTGVAVGSATITVTTEDGGFNATCALTVAAFNGFTKVTDASVLQSGDEIIFVNADNNVALSTTQNENNRSETDVTITDGTRILPSASVQIAVLESAEDYWYLNVGDDAYLYAASSSKNYLRTAAKATAGNNGKWDISISNGNATIVAQGSNTNNRMQYNSSSSIFSCYGSDSQKAITLFRRAKKTVTSLALNVSPKSQYTVGDHFDPTGLEVTVNYDRGDPETVSYADHFSDFTITVGGSPYGEVALLTSHTSARIAYGGQYIDFPITVSYAAPESIIITVDDATVTAPISVGCTQTIYGAASVSPANAQQDAGWTLRSATKTAGGNYASGAEFDYELDIDGSDFILELHTTFDGTFLFDAKSAADQEIASMLTINVNAQGEVTLDPDAISVLTGTEEPEELSHIIGATPSNFAGEVTYSWSLSEDAENVAHLEVDELVPDIVELVLDNVSAEVEFDVEVTAAYGTYQEATALCHVTITEAKVVSVTLDKASATIFTGDTGNTVDLTATASAIGGVSTDLRWEISDSDPSAAVSLSGTTGTTVTVNALLAGTATVHVYSKYNRDHSIADAEAECTITISDDSVASFSWTNKGTPKAFVGATLADAIASIKSDWSMTATWASSKIESFSDGKGLGTGANDIHLGLYSTSAPASETTGHQYNLPLSYVFTEEDRINAPYLVAYYHGIRSKVHSRIELVSRLNSISHTAIDEDVTLTWTASNKDSVAASATGTINTSNTSGSISETWDFERSNNYIDWTGGTGADAKNYHQIGSSKTDPGFINFETQNSISHVKNVTVFCAAASGADPAPTISISVGSTAFADGVDMKARTADYANEMSYDVPENADASGIISIELGPSTAKVGIIIHSVSVTYGGGTHEEEFANSNYNAQRAVIDFADAFTGLMDKSNVCGTGEDAGKGVNYESDAFGNAWDDAIEAFETILTHPNTGSDAGTYGTYKLTADELAFAKKMLEYGYATWEDDTRGVTPVARDTLQRALKTYDHVVTHSDLTAFMSEIRTPSLALNVFGNHSRPSDSPLTTTLWIVLGSGLAGLAAIGSAYWISKKRRPTA